MRKSNFVTYIESSEMGDDSPPALQHVILAREHAKLSNFDAALRAYQNAKQEVEFNIETCNDRSFLSKWSTLLKDIGTEEASIRRIKATLDRIMERLDEDEDPSQMDGNGDEPVISLQWSKREDNNDMGQLRAPERRPIVNESKPRRPAPNRQQVIQKHVPQAKQPANNNKKQLAAPTRPAPPQKVNAAQDTPPKNDPSLDPANNPLVEQIIGMGILVREPNVQWDSIAGLTQVKRLLRQNLVILPMRPDICKGLLAPWKSVLFYGPPGTGKTFLAKAVATECKRTFFNVTSATITSKWHGESEKLVAYLFTLADQMAPSTIFFDEIDSVASQRGGGQEHEASRRMKAQLLTKLEGIDGASDNSAVFVLAATNFPWDLDEALLRRFQKRIYIPLPDQEGRLAILKMNLTDLIDEDFDLDLWASKLEGYSCADITNLCRDAAQYVFDKQTSMLDTQAWVNMPAEEARVIIRDDDFARAISLRKPSVDPNTLAKYEEWRKTKGAE